MSYYIGIDVSKATINVHISKNSQDLVLENSIKGFKSLSSKLKKIYKKEIENIVFIFEPTGSIMSPDKITNFKNIYIPKQ